MPGVEQHAFYLKEVDDSRRIRQRIHDNFEASTYPGLSQDHIRKLLTFVVVGLCCERDRNRLCDSIYSQVGGGPVGVEFAGELTDLLREDCSRVRACLWHITALR